MTTAWDLQETIRGIRGVPVGSAAGKGRRLRRHDSGRLSAAVGDLCEITTRDRQPVLAEVIGFRDARCHLLPFHRAKGDCRRLSRARAFSMGPCALTGRGC